MSKSDNLTRTPTNILKRAHYRGSWEDSPDADLIDDLERHWQLAKDDDPLKNLLRRVITRIKIG